jgi:Spy/CpxP family protein refolding chaperone
MKKGLILLFSVLLISVLSLSAQPPQRGKGGPKVTPKERAEKMAKELELTDTQKADLQALFEKQETERKEKIEKAKEEKSGKKTDFEAERKAMEQKLEKIIGKEKYDKWKESMSKRSQNRKKE